jgi:Reverse transcriptase (RNA-dependent DNA polymerase)
VRYADDFVMGFENKEDAQEMLLALKARLTSFGLTLHEDKTRLIEFGRFAALSRQRRGERRPETLAFLGFTHYCGRTRDGRFIVKHKTEGKRLTRKLTALRQEAWRPCTSHWPRSTSGSPLCCVDTTATTAGRTIIQRSTASTAKCVRPGCAV